MKKKWIAMMLALVMFTATVGCGSGKNTTDLPPEQETATEAGPTESINSGQSEEQYADGNFESNDAGDAPNINTEDFWLDRDTFDLIGYVEAKGGTVDYGSDSSDPDEVNYCSLDFYFSDDCYLTLYCDSYDANRSPRIGAGIGYQIIGNQIYIDGNCPITKVEDIGRLVYIQNHNYQMPHKYLYQTLTVIDRIAANDPDCWLRDFGITHSVTGDGPHDD